MERQENVLCAEVRIQTTHVLLATVKMGIWTFGAMTAKERITVSRMKIADNMKTSNAIPEGLNTSYHQSMTGGILYTFLE